MLYIASFIEQQLKNARYEYDDAVKEWCAWVPSLPGAYAQARSVEEVRTALAEVIEDYLIVALQKGKARTLFKKRGKRTYAAA